MKDKAGAALARADLAGDEKRWDCLRALTHAGQLDLHMLDILGLIDMGGRHGACPHCGNLLSRDGRCRRSSCYPGLPAADRPAPTPVREVEPELAEKIVRAYKGGLAMRATARRFQISERRVRRVLVEAGVPLRGRGFPA